MSTINCTPIKPQVSFNGNNEKVTLYLPSEKTDQFDEYVQTHDIKAPVAAAISVMLAAGLAFASGKRIGALISSKLAKNAPNLMEQAIQKGSKHVNTAKEALKNASSGKMVKVKNFAGQMIENASGAAAKGYSKLQTIGLPKDATAADKVRNGFNNLFGVAALATVFPSFMTRDGNKNGLSDILENGQNTYTGQSTYGKTKAKMEGLYSFVQQVVDVVS